ncbi:F-box domain protein [Favolaschia claudopus]|uniref:F-box domain protein n=1 Tax=Favolaschia claudopus TaxID=2862362 RepID=A0AAW0CY85_9AGAR
MRDLLCIAPLVSKMWQATTTTPCLQRILFFEPDPSANPSRPTQNPLLAGIFSPFFTRLVNKFTFPWPGTLGSIKAMPWAKNSDAFRRAGASWRRMLVTQPPVRTLAVRRVNNGTGGFSYRLATMSDLSLRMGYLYDLVLPFTEDGMWFCVDWDGAGSEHDSDATLHFCTFLIDGNEPVKRDTQFESEDMQIVEISFGPSNFVGDDLLSVFQ